MSGKSQLSVWEALTNENVWENRIGPWNHTAGDIQAVTVSHRVLLIHLAGILALVSHWVVLFTVAWDNLNEYKAGKWVDRNKMIVNKQNICYACGDVNDENNCIECEKIDLALGLLKLSRNKTFLQRHTRKIKADIVAYEREFQNWMFLIKLFSFYLVLTQIILILF